MKNFFTAFIALFLFASLLMTSCSSNAPEDNPEENKIEVQTDWNKFITIGELKAQADTGSLEAMHHLGEYYERQLNLSSAEYWYLKAAESGDNGSLTDIVSYYMIYKPGKAIKWCKKLAKTDTKAYLPLAQLYIQKGRFAKAAKWGLKAAFSGDPQAELLFASFLKELQPVQWYKSAAEKGNAEAMYEVGRCYRYGLDVPENPLKAIEWYKKAALKHDISSLHALAEMYMNGEGVDADQSKAQELLELSAVLESSPVFDTKESLHEFNDRLKKALAE